MQKRKIKPGQLIHFGFSERESGYIYSIDLIDGQFEMVVFVAKEGKMSSEVIDNSTKERWRSRFDNKQIRRCF